MTSVDVEDYAGLQHARKLWNEGRVESALGAFESALEERPSNVRAHVEFARAWGQLHEIARAESLLEKALSLSLDHAPTIIVIARGLRSIFRQSRALEVLGALRERGLLPPSAVGEVAVLYEQCGQLDAAIDAVDECIAAAPGQHEPQLIRARLLRQRNSLDESEGVLRKLAAVADAPPMLTVGCQTELCQILDRRGEYDQAVAAIERAKQVLRQLPGTSQLRESSQRINRLFARLYAELDEATWERWLTRHDCVLAEQHGDIGGVAHLLGFPRSGTTLLEQALDTHPGILAAPERAVFSKLIFPAISQSRGRHEISVKALDASSDAVLRYQERRYLRLHREIHGQPWQGRIHLDKNPNHMSLLAPLVRLLPSAKYVIARRDPRDVIVSVYLRFFPLSEYSAAFLDWESLCRLYLSEMAIWTRMREWLQGHWIEVKYEDMVTDLEAEAGKVVTFLGLKPCAGLANHVARREPKWVNSPSHVEVRQPVYSRAIGRWRNYEKYLAPYLSKLPEYH